MDEKINSTQKIQEPKYISSQSESSKLVNSFKQSQDSKPNGKSPDSSKQVRPKPLQKPKLKCVLCNYTNHSINDCYRILYCMKCKKEDHRTSDHDMYIASMKSSQNYKAQPYQYASPSKQILKSKAKPYPPCTHYGFNDHRPDDCRNYPKCEICRIYDHFTSGHNHAIQVRGRVLAESSQSSESSIGVCVAGEGEIVVYLDSCKTRIKHGYDRFRRFLSPVESSTGKDQTMMTSTMKFLRAIPSSYGVNSCCAPTHLLSLECLTLTQSLPYYDSQEYCSSVSQTFGRSDNVMECVLHFLLPEDEPDQEMLYETLTRFDRRKVRCYKCLQLGHFARECNVKTVDDKARYSAFKVTEVKTDEPKALVSVDSMVNWSDHAAENKTGEVEKVYGMMAGLHADNGGADVSEAAAEFAMMGISPKVQNCPLGCDSKLNDLNNMYNNLDRLYNDCYIKVQAYQNAVKTLESQKDWYHKTQIALEEKIRVLSANLENTANTLSYTEKLHDQAQKEKKEWEVKFEATLARFEKWKESSKNLQKLINSSMSTRTKIGLGFKEYFGKDEVFDLSTPSVMYPEPVEEVKPLYSWFVKAGEMHAVPPSITGTYMPTPYKSDIEETQVSYGSKSDNKTSETLSESNDFVSCDNSDKSSDSETYASCESSLKTKTKDYPSAVDIKTLPESDVEDPNSTAGSPSFSCLENVKSPRIFCNKSGMNNRNVCKNNSVRVKKCFVCGSKLHLIKDCDFYNCVDSVPCKSKAASVPAGSRNSSASVPADGSDPAASRNRPAVNSAGRPKPTERFGHPAGWSKRPAPVSADSPVSAGWLNPAARPYFRPSSVYFNNMYWPNFYDPMYMNKGRRGTAGDPSTDNDIGQGRHVPIFGGGDGRLSGNRHHIRLQKLYFGKYVYYVEELQHFNLFSVSQICDTKNKVLFTDTDCLVLSKEFQLPDDSQVVLRIPRERDLYTFSIFLGGGSFIKQWVRVVMGTQCDYASRLAKLQRQEYEAKDAAARYGYLFSQATAEILCQAEAEIRNQGVSAVRDPAGIDSADGVSAGSPSAGSDPAGSDPAGGNPADSFQPAGSFEPADESNPAVSSSVSADFNPVHADEFFFYPTPFFFPPGQQLGSSENTTRFPVPSDVCMDQLSSGIFTSSSYDDDFSATLTNLAPVVDVNPVPTRRVNTIHPQSQILGDLSSPVLTRSRAQKSKFGESAFIGYIQDQQRTNHTDQLHCLFGCFLSQLEPTSIAKALEDPDWVAAMQEEMQQFINQQVWKLVPLPDGKHAIGTKWILKNKRDARGIVVRNKAYGLVAQGHRQEEGIDYDEVFAPVARIEAIRLFLAFASYMGFLVYQMDVKSAFLYGEIEEEVYVTQPKGFEDPIPKHVYIVVKALYGTSSSTRGWCDERDNLEMSAMGEMNFFLGLQVKTIADGYILSAKTGLWYPKDSPFQLEAYSDSDYAGSHGDRKSTTGGCQFLGRRLISWQCKKQKIMLLLNVAEYVLSFLLDAFFQLVAMDYAAGSVFRVGHTYVLGYQSPAEDLNTAGSNLFLLSQLRFCCAQFDIVGWLVSATSHLVSAGSIQSCWWNIISAA
ncbi:putative ribonuclease H-like domain-containing protein [Tanacetum coccineum]